MILNVCPHRGTVGEMASSWLRDKPSSEIYMFGLRTNECQSTVFNSRGRAEAVALPLLLDLSLPTKLLILTSTPTVDALATVYAANSATLGQEDVLKCQLRA